MAELKHVELIEPEADAKALHEERRLKLEKELTKVQNEITATKDRLRQVRKATKGREQADVALDMQNLCKELVRLEAKASRTQRHLLKNFEESLDLDQLGLDKHLITKGVKDKENEKEVKEEHRDVMTDKEVEDETLMRTKSTQNMEGKNPKEKWQGLYRMFQEWKYQKAVADASSIVKRKIEPSDLTDEILKLRTTIYKMKQRKNLSEADEKLVKEMGQRLQHLISTQETKAKIQLESYE